MGSARNQSETTSPVWISQPPANQRRRSLGSGANQSMKAESSSQSGGRFSEVGEGQRANQSTESPGLWTHQQPIRARHAPEKGSQSAGGGHCRPAANQKADP